MKPQSLCCTAILIYFVSCAAHAATKIVADLPPPEKRKALLEIGFQLIKPTNLPASQSGVINPFDPAGFGQVERSTPDTAMSQAAKRATPTQPPSDRELLQAIAGKIAPTGTIFSGSDPILLFGKKSVKIGAKFTVSYSGVDYALELTAIDRTTFTLRLNREEIIRPIKPGK